MMGIRAIKCGVERRLAAAFGDFRDNEDGATAIEYSLIAALIAIAIIASLRAMSDEVSTLYESIGSEVENVA